MSPHYILKQCLDSCAFVYHTLQFYATSEKKSLIPSRSSILLNSALLINQQQWVKDLSNMVISVQAYPPTSASTGKGSTIAQILSEGNGHLTSIAMLCFRFYLSSFFILVLITKDHGIYLHHSLKAALNSHDNPHLFNLHHN